MALIGRGPVWSLFIPLRSPLRDRSYGYSSPYSNSAVALGGRALEAYFWPITTVFALDTTNCRLTGDRRDSSCTLIQRSNVDFRAQRRVPI